MDRLLAAEPEVRRDAPDSVHQMRVATRRLRSVLRSYRKLFGKETVAAMSTELKWLAGLLGAARDAEVRADRFETLLAEHAGQASPDDLEAVTARLVLAERDRYRAAHEQTLTALDQERYRDLRSELSRWRTEPPLRHSRAAVPAADFFAAVLRRDLERLQALVRAEPTVAATERVERLHDIRKSAKRLRYSCEAAEQTVGSDAADLGKRAKHLQTILGDHRDTVESHETILARAAEAAAVGERTGTYEILATAEDAAAGHALRHYPATAAAVFGQPGSS
ncbi:CHAD domain-containing protein [Nocardia sp. NPDC049220]|uniref:CHAD domain-containing protein n=1 Tax=Nocardia sp. NPDC049220 TaxID=3155273 RepID=UPI0033F5E2DF